MKRKPQSYIYEINVEDHKNEFGTQILRLHQGKSDNPIHILIECPDRPSINIDIENTHARRVFSMRIDGMSIFGGLLDVKQLPGKSSNPQARFCSMCGEEFCLFSSKSHYCKEE